MSDNHVIFTDLILILGSATLVATIFHSLRLPPIVGFLIAGILVGPHGLGWVKTVMRVELLTEIAGILLMFTIGLEFSLRQLRALQRIFLSLGGGQMGMTIGVSLFVLRYGFDLSWPQSFFFSSIIALSSTAVVLKLLKEGRNLDSPFGQTSLAILLFQDFSVIPLLLIVPLLAEGGGEHLIQFDTLMIGMFLMKSMGLILFIGMCARWIVPFVLDRVVRTRSSEVFFFSVLFICGGTALLIEKIGLSLSLGAFFAGLMISSSPFGKQATAEFAPLRDNFLGLFFVSIGMLLSLDFLASNTVQIFAFALGISLLKFICIYLVLWFAGHSSSVASVTALILFQIGEFSFILADRGRVLGLMSDRQYQYFLAVSIISLILTPLLYRIAPKLGFRDKPLSMVSQRFQNLAKSLKIHWIRSLIGSSSTNQESAPQGGHSLIIGFGIAGQEVASALKSLRLPYRIIEMNGTSVREGLKRGEPIFFGDGSKEEILHQGGLERAHLVILVVNSLDITEAILRTIYRIRPEIKVLVRLQYMRDLEKLDFNPNLEPVISEFETSLEILARTLRAYGADEKQIYDFTLEAHQRLKSSRNGIKQSERRTIDIPAWQALANLYPMKLKSDSYAAGKTLGELDLRKRTGATLISVFRDGLGVAVPDADFALERNDTLYLLGTSESIKSAELFLTKDSVLTG
jgi:CPA2 family monovalent cation:H+ antiporter-2